MVDVASAIAPFDQFGFCIVPDAFPARVLDDLTLSMEWISREGAPGTRNLANLLPAVARLAESQEIAGLLASLGLPGGFLVRSILFDKQAGANWKVPWHQDLTIAVRERKEVAGFGPWSEKRGVPHVQPPVEILERMVTLRIHLDECDQDNGPLRVLPGSHRHGVLCAESIKRWRLEHSEVICSAARGAVLAMRPLLLHASSQAIRPRHRRVIHLEFEATELSGGLEWKC